MFKKLLPKENRFFTLFNEHCAIVVQGLEVFEALQEKQADKSELNRQLKEIEHRADNIAHQVFALLNTVFVTPFDREDIRSLIHHMDDIMDMIENEGDQVLRQALARLFDTRVFIPYC
nr:DUF47 family protein [uncultured Desulfobacter sp.]